jgi:hypothetical protein
MIRSIAQYAKKAIAILPLKHYPLNQKKRALKMVLGGACVAASFLVLAVDYMNPTTASAQRRTNRGGNPCRAQVDVYFEPIEIYADQLLNGDGDIYGRGDFVLTANAQTNNQGEIFIRVTFDNSERSPDYTYLRGERVFRQYVPELDQGQCILTGISPRSGEVQGTGRWQDHSKRNYGGNGLIARSRIRLVD